VHLLPFFNPIDGSDAGFEHGRTCGNWAPPPI
jgi:hypothetical protein